MKTLIGKYWALILAIAVLWAVVVLLLLLSLKQNQGHLIYALDDAYIHMAIAKNFVKNGVWGITRYGFSSSSSSLIWTLILSLIYFLFGVNEAAPFILNVVLATFLISLIYALLEGYKTPRFYSFIILLAVIFITPLPALIFSGMEHILQIIVVTIFVVLAAKALSKEYSSSMKFGPLSLLALAPLVTLVRYESLFFVLVICALFVMHKQWSYSFLLGALAIFPIDLYGIISVKNGWFWLPSSILIKGVLAQNTLKGVPKILAYSSYRLLASPHILFLLIAALVLFLIKFNKKRSIWDNEQMLISIFVVTSILHLQFIRLDWFYRYEAYLVVLGIFTIAIAIVEYIPGRSSFRGERSLAPKYAAMMLLALMVSVPFFQRGYGALVFTPQATTNIYEQQYQMGLFLRDFYQGEVVAANDIGAINYLADIKSLDLVGLGSIEIAEAKAHGHYDTSMIFAIAKAKRAKIAIVYDHWFYKYGGIPSEWIKIGEWKISNNIVCGGDTVSFYAVNSSEANTLKSNLVAFAPHLPQNVIYVLVDKKTERSQY